MLHDFSKDTFDILILAGQSNAYGSSFGPAEAPYCPDGRIWYMNEDGTISLAAEAVEGNGIRACFALSFAREYVNAGKLAEGRKLLILRTAAGGTGFSDNRWKLTDDLYLRMMDMTRTALALNPDNRLVAFLWHQGETDAIRRATYDFHYHHLSTLLSTVRETFRAPALPFIAGDFVHHWKYNPANLDACFPVLDAIHAVCRDFEACAFVETDGLDSNAQGKNPPESRKYDDIHFSRDATYELGKRYFAAFEAIVND